MNKQKTFLHQLYQSRLLIRDNFTGANGTLLSAHAISPLNKPGAVWTAAASWTLSNNQAVCSATPVPINMRISAVKANCIIELLLGAGATGGNVFGIIARWQDVNNFWAFGTTSTTLYIFEVNDNIWTNRASNANYPKSGILRAILNGNNLSLSIANSNPLTYTSASFNTCTIHGCRTALGVTIDDFKLTQL